ncbi:WxL domain-containing protein [Vagococcus fessus]|uniref:WxL domain-containing protein n=1 Tax=Vagococcus fessus TaxID=120370 RepID=A0A430A7A1_9ENTE|nr:WxL domain-containing protein [Vagococcus fessus]RSU02982.1 hypothetical protein CBF31_04450 [Vagococcus fessus]
MKNTMKLMTVVLISTSVLGAATSFAAGETSKATTEGKVQFTNEDNNEVEPPVNPETDPEGEVVEPGEEPGGEQGTAGPLQINWVSNFDFDINKVSMVDKFYDAKLTNDKKTKKPLANFVQLTDKRGTGEGWSLSVTQKGEFTSEKNILDGARIHLKNGNITSNLGEETFPSMDLKETPAEGAEEISGQGTLVPDQKLPLMTATEKKGMGRYSLYFGKTTDGSAESSVQLEVPGNIVKYADVAYTTALEWNLESAKPNIEE